MFKKLMTLAATAALLATVPATADEASLDKTLDEVLAAHFETIGGEDAWRALDSVSMTGTMAMAQMGIEAPVSMWFKTPNMTRIEFTVQGMTGIQAYDGEAAWMVMPFMGVNSPEPMPADMAEQMAEQADVNPFLDWEEKEYQVELLAKEDVDGTEAYKIKLTRPSGNVRYYYLDSEHFLPFKVEGKTTFQGQEVDSVTILGDYKEVGDLIFPHSIESMQGDATTPGQVLTITAIDIETSVDASKFDMSAEMPEPAEPTADG